jgi:hypothetical protein
MPTGPINILVLAARASTDEADTAAYPAFMAETGGISLIERLLANLQGLHDAQVCFALIEDEVRRFHLDNVVGLLRPGARIAPMPRGTKGAACTALLAASTMDPAQELLILSANEVVDAPIAAIVQRFRERHLDAGTISFRSIQPRYSYVQLDAEGLVTEATQKNPISHHATTGVFWWRQTGRFVETVQSMIRKDAHVDGEFYICPAFNEMLLQQANIGVEPIATASYHPLKTERQRARFEHPVEVQP